MMVYFILILSGYILGNVYVLVRGLQALGHFSLLLRGTFSVLYVLCSLLFLCVFIFRNAKIPFSVGHVLFQIGTGWLVFVLYMVIFLVLTDLIKVFNRSFQHGFSISLVLTFSLLVYGYINYQLPNKQVINIDINKSLVDVDKLRIVAVSDWHLGLGTSNRQLERAINFINAEKPDIILIAGDLIDNSIAPVAARNMDKQLNRLQAPLGVYMAPGNHEYISGFDACKVFLSKTNIQLLIDSAVTLPCGLQIIGRDDFSNQKRLTANEWIYLTDVSKPMIIIDHQPFNLNEAQQIKADLQVSGHTHDGQVYPIKWITNRLFEISYGYQQIRETHYYVTSGIALWGPPFRIGTTSEMVVFECSFSNK